MIRPRRRWRPWPGGGAPALGALAVATLVAPRIAAAQDGAYGRLDGDLDVSLGAGAAVAAGAPGLAARASAVYAQIAGLHVGYVDALGQPSALVDRSIAAGVTLKPLFWGRFANELERGPARLDLFLDSFVFELGAFWAAPRGRDFVTEPGLEIALGLGFPIFSDATGPFIEVRGALRYRREDLTGAVPSDALDRGALLTVTLAWHHVLPAHIADAGDRLVR
jgi:hypothetical protein